MQSNCAIQPARRFQGSTFECMVTTFTEHFGPFDASPIGPSRNFLWKADCWTDGTATLVSSQYSAEWRVRTVRDTPEWLSILLPRSGAIDVTLGREVVEGRRGQLLLVNNHQAEHFLARGTPHVSDVLRLDWAVIAQTVARTLEVPLIGSLDLLSKVDLSTQAGQLIGSIVEAIVLGMRDNGPLLHCPLAMSNLTQGLADLLVRSVPHRLSNLLDKKPVMIAPWHVYDAIDFMWANIDQPITMPIVAEAVGVSTRALESGFRRFKETSPATYLRTIRLSGVRSDLADPLNRQSVKEICLKWGFVHFGRFSAAYRAAYGENPSDTKRRSARI